METAEKKRSAIWLPLGIVAIAAIWLIDSGRPDQSSPAPVTYEAISPSAYKRVLPGMTLGEVQQIVGSPGSQASLTNVAGIKAVAYSWVNANGSNAQMIFQGNSHEHERELALATKAQFGLE